ncbi:MAG: hypothetical protein IH968_10205 [Gemmatimonadetes bacterium]|nr:hypothetical protein [Gemmatimonadota bacterium]
MAKRLRNGLAIFAGVILIAGVLSGCAGDTSDVEQEIAGLETQVQLLQAAQVEASAQLMALEEQLRGAAVGATLVVKPSIFKFPERRLSTRGDVWFSGSGLEPGQRFTLTIEAFGVEGVVVPLPGDLRQASDEGTFAVGTPGIRPGRFLDPEIELRGGAFLVKLWDTETEALLATTPWLVCGQSRENEWCGAAVETAIVPEPVVEGAGTVFNIARIRIGDGFFQLRVGPTPLFGYEADSRIDSNVGDGWVMTIALGDSILISERLENRGTVDHHLTIADLGIDVTLTPDQRITDGFVIKPDKVGEFVINDSSDPDGHGKALLIVTE